MIDATIQTLSQFIEYVSSQDFVGHTGGHARAWFRGQSDASWQLRPSVYRKGFLGEDSEVGPALSDRLKRIQLERHLTQDFLVRSGPLVPSHSSDVDLYLLQQHFGMPTRLLDWTNSPLVALYFAVSNRAHADRDGSFAALDAYKFSGGGGIATNRRAELVNSVKRIAEWDDSAEFPEHLIPVRPIQHQARMSLQRAGFTFHVPQCPAVTKTENSTLVQAVIPASRKEPLRKELLNVGIDAAGVFGDLVGLSTAIRESFGL